MEDHRRTDLAAMLRESSRITTPRDQITASTCCICKPGWGGGGILSHSLEDADARWRSDGDTDRHNGTWKSIGASFWPQCLAKAAELRHRRIKLRQRDLAIASQEGERYWHTVSSILAPAGVTRMASTDRTQLGRPSTTRACDHASRKRPHCGNEGSTYDTNLLPRQAQ